MSGVSGKLDTETAQRNVQDLSIDVCTCPIPLLHLRCSLPPRDRLEKDCTVCNTDTIRYLSDFPLRFPETQSQAGHYTPTIKISMVNISFVPTAATYH